MGENSRISWTDHTFSAWLGCAKLSPACDFCYAEAWAKRAGRSELWAGGRKRTTTQYWREPLKWETRAAATGQRERVFCASLADVFDNKAPPEWRDDLWRLIAATPHLDWLLLTKRPQNIADMLPPSWGLGWPNVWLGTTAENETELRRRAPHLVAIPAVVRFLSCEPLLSGLDLRPWLPRLDWVIAGGESGPHARPSDPRWFRMLRDQCAGGFVPFFFKQHGEWIGALDLAGLPGAASPDGDSSGAYGHCRHDAALGVVRVGTGNAGNHLDGRLHLDRPLSRPTGLMVSFAATVGTAPLARRRA